VLRKHWPEVPCYEDVRNLTANALERDGIAVDVITGGFPCQDISTAGRQAGLGKGTRSGLWSEIVRLTRELSPRYIIVENVANLLSGPSEQRGGWFGRVLGDLAECGYDAEWQSIRASSLGAWHHRNRIWIIAWPSIGRNLAYSDKDSSRRQADPRVSAVSSESGERLLEGRNKEGDCSDATENGRAGCKRRNVGQGPFEASGVELWFESGGVCSNGAPRLSTNASEIGQSGSGQSLKPISKTPRPDWEAVKPVTGRIGDIWRAEPAVGRVADGVPNRVDRLGGCGNAVVPQIPEIIGYAILATEARQ
jgi:DNA (cytosine-5)-methyltransferase 1